MKTDRETTGTPSFEAAKKKNTTIPAAQPAIPGLIVDTVPVRPIPGTNGLVPATKSLMPDVRTYDSATDGVSDLVSENVEPKTKGEVEWKIWKRGPKEVRKDTGT